MNNRNEFNHYLQRDMSRDLKRDHNSIYTTLYNKGKPVNSVKLDRDICNIVVLLNEQECYTTSSCQKISFGIYAGFTWIQFDSALSYQRLLRLIRDKNHNSGLLKWLCGGSSPCGTEPSILCKPMMTGEMRIDLYLHPCDINFFEKGLVSLKKIKSKL